MLRTAQGYRAFAVVLVLVAAGPVASEPTALEISAIQIDSTRENMSSDTSDPGSAAPPDAEGDRGEPSGDSDPVTSGEGLLPSGFLDRVVQVNGVPRPFVVYVPVGYSPSHAWPAILFLHGRAESGIDGRRQLAQGLAPAILKRRDAWPFVVVFPQKMDPEKRWTDEGPMLSAILDDVDASWHLDPARRYLTGLSQGGHGTLALAMRLPWRFAALASVCGWADDPAATAATIASVPLWAFHGEDDPIVPVRRSVELVEAVQRSGGQVRLTRYPAVGHDAWYPAYDGEDLARWLLSHPSEPGNGFPRPPTSRGLAR